ncbi:MAG: transcriptional regulator [Ponticaulis sp.]|nr:transcriptional regulator [Ponticaulis sp.]
MNAFKQVEEYLVAKRRSVTIKEVAELAGVSQMTVSRVLNRAETVRQETRTRVQSAIQELNYRPNLMARHLAGGRTRLTGLLHDGAHSSELSELIVCALQSCRDSGQQLILEQIGPVEPMSPDMIDEAVSAIAAAGLDGLIVPPHLANQSRLIDRLSELPLTLVVLGGTRADERFARISHHDRAGGFELTSLLVRNGHKRIGFVADQSEGESEQDRLAGYRDALMHHNIPFEDKLIATAEVSLRGGVDAGRALIGHSDRPTAIIGATDKLAAGVVSAAHLEGLKVPFDLSVVGFGDTEAAGAVWPQLTTIRRPLSRMVELAVDYLAKSGFPDDVDGAELVTPQHLNINTIDLIERDSVAASG